MAVVRFCALLLLSQMAAAGPRPEAAPQVSPAYSSSSSPSAAPTYTSSSTAPAYTSTPSVAPTYTSSTEAPVYTSTSSAAPYNLPAPPTPPSYCNVANFTICSLASCDQINEVVGYEVSVGKTDGTVETMPYYCYSSDIYNQAAGTFDPEQAYENCSWAYPTGSQFEEYEIYHQGYGPTEAQPASISVMSYSGCSNVTLNCNSMYFPQTSIDTYGQSTYYFVTYTTCTTGSGYGRGYWAVDTGAKGVPKDLFKPLAEGWKVALDKAGTGKVSK